MHISIGIFCNLFICLVFDGLLQSICFRMVCSKHSITFDTYLLNCRFHCVDIFYINVRSCETFTITNSGAILFYWLKYCLTLELWNNDLSIPTNVCFSIVIRTFASYDYGFRLVQVQIFCICRLAFLRFTFHWYLHGSNKNIKNMHTVSINQIADIFHFNDN